MPEDLFRGLAVVIDDEADTNNSDDLIVTIVKKIKDRGIPVVSYSKLEDATRFAPNLPEINFIILDWRLYKTSQGVRTPAEVREQNAKKNVQFLQGLKKGSFTPVFIFSSDSEADVISELNRLAPGLYLEDQKRNFIFIKSKNALIDGDSLFTEVNNWALSNPTIYTLKKWENSFLKSKNESFWTLFQKSPIWPSVLWNSFEKDSVDASYSISEQVYRIIRGRSRHEPLDKGVILTSGNDEIQREDFAEVIRATMYVESSNLLGDDVQPGDIFQTDDSSYKINIRPSCDTVAKREGFDGDLYLLSGKKMQKAAIKESFKGKFGLVQPSSAYVLFGVEGIDFFKFAFKKLEIRKYDDLKTKRIQRLLPPHISHLQHSYSAYAGRVGTPRFPDDFVKSLLEEQ